MNRSKAEQILKTEGFNCYESAIFGGDFVDRYSKKDSWVTVELSNNENRNLAKCRITGRQEWIKNTTSLQNLIVELEPTTEQIEQYYQEEARYSR